MKQSNGQRGKVVFIGVTGGVGAGKSELLNHIKKHYKCEIYLADEVAHKVKRRGTACYRELVALLGEDILAEDGRIDKAAMARKIFSDAKLLAQVNGIVHPAVKKYLLGKLEKARKNPEIELFFVEAALLIEDGYGDLVDEMWYIYADEAVRRERLSRGRGYSRERIDGIMANQLSDEEFRTNSDFVIDNSGTPAESCRQIDRRLEAFTWLE